MNIFAGVFQIFTNVIEPDHYQFWNPGYRFNSSGTGFGVKINEKKYIITNNHVIKYSNFMECSKFNSDKLFQLELIDHCPELDLALLEPEDPEFWTGIPILNIKKPGLKGSEIQVIGFPQGNYNPSITKGIISRIIPVLYSKAILNLAIQVDSAINPGNSGGPVLDNQNNIIGVAFSHNVKGQNICYIIPSVLVMHFIRGIEKFGKFPGICDLEIQTQSTENLILQNYYGGSGILVEKVNQIGNMAHLLEPGDLITKIDNIPIRSDTCVYLKNYEIVPESDPESELFPYWHILRIKYPGEIINLEIIRNHKIKNLKSELGPIKHDLIETIYVDFNYYCFGGLFFVPLNIWYLYKKGKEKVVDEEKWKLFKYMESFPESSDQQIVILTDILESKFTSGYFGYDLRLVKINDIEIKNLLEVQHICEKFKKINKNKKSEEFIKFEFDTGRIIILNLEAGLESDNITKKYLHISYTSLDKNESN